MSGPARVGARGAGAGGPLHVRQPRPLGRGAFVVAAVLVVASVAMVVVAGRSDGGVATGERWRGWVQPPRASRVDTFDGSGAMDRDAPGALAWVAPQPGWERRYGVATPSDARTAALVEAGSVDALVVAQFSSAAPGSGLVVSASKDLAEAFELLATSSGWRLVERSPKGEITLAEIAVPWRRVVAQVVRKGDRLEAVVAGRRGERRTSVTLFGDSPAGTEVGLVGGGGGEAATAVDLFGYLPLPTA